jgi:hypothetical protein
MKEVCHLCYMVMHFQLRLHSYPPTEGKRLCLLEFRSLSDNIETVLGELHVLQCLTWYSRVTRQNTVRVLRDLYPSKKYTGYKTTYNSGPDDEYTPVYKLKNLLVEAHYSLPCVACLTNIFNYGSNIEHLFNEGILSQNALKK